jgi:transposase
MHGPININPLSPELNPICYLLALLTALNVSGFTITHLQEHKTTVTTVSGNHYTVLLSAAIVEELELTESSTTPS